MAAPQHEMRRFEYRSYLDARKSAGMARFPSPLALEGLMASNRGAFQNVKFAYSRFFLAYPGADSGNFREPDILDARTGVLLPRSEINRVSVEGDPERPFSALFVDVANIHTRTGGFVLEALRINAVATLPNKRGREGLRIGKLDEQNGLVVIDSDPLAIEDSTRRIIAMCDHESVRPIMRSGFAPRTIIANAPLDVPGTLIY